MLAEQLKLLLTRVPFAVKIYELNLQRQLLLLLLSIIKLRQLIGTWGKIRGCFQNTYPFLGFENNSYENKFFKKYICHDFFTEAFSYLSFTKVSSYPIYYLMNLFFGSDTFLYL